MGVMGDELSCAADGLLHGGGPRYGIIGELCLHISTPAWVARIAHILHCCSLISQLVSEISMRGIRNLSSIEAGQPSVGISWH